MAGDGNIERFTVSAPGKVILHGEHSVVHGYPAVAGPIALRTYLSFTALKLSPATAGPEMVLEFRSIPFSVRMSLDSFDAFLRDIDCNGSLQPAEFLQQLRATDEVPFARFLSHPDQLKNARERVSLGVALYVINRVLRAEDVRSVDRSCVGDGGFQLSLSSEMSIGAGLGSSASYGVCLAAGAYVLSRILKRELGPDEASMDGVLEDVLDKICGWAYDSEVILHEKPSGIDNTIATYGKLVRFRRGEPFQPVALNHPLHVLIVDTRVSRSTAQLVDAVKTRHQLFPRTIGPILDAMGGLVEEAIGLFKSDDESSTVFQRLSMLVGINNNLLRTIGASHPSLERIFSIAEAHGFACKLTGAGGGGCAFVLLPAQYRDMVTFRQLREALQDAGFVTTETTVGVGFGVKLSSSLQEANRAS